MKLPRNRRITRRSDFARVREAGESVRGRHFVLGYLKDETADPLKLGIITTRRLGNAVIRARVRRRVRGIIHRIGDRIAAGYFLVVVARHSSATATSAQLEKEFKWLLHRSSLMRPKP